MVTASRLTSSLRAVRRAPRLIRSQQAYRSFAVAPRLNAQQGYGDGTGDPVAENPQKQPESNKAQESSEHPGPAPPDVGQGRKSGEKSPEDASAASGGSRSKEASETGSSPTGGSIGGGEGNSAPSGTHRGGEGLKGPQGEGAPQPTIMNQSIPGAKPGLTEAQKREVENHNVDFDKRHDRSSKAPDDLVDKKFWQGDAGPKREGTENDWNA